MNLYFWPNLIFEILLKYLKIYIFFEVKSIAYKEQRLSYIPEVVIMQLCKIFFKCTKDSTKATEIQLINFIKKYNTEKVKNFSKTLKVPAPRVCKPVQPI